MKLLFLLPFLLGLVSPAIAHNEANTKCGPNRTPICQPPYGCSCVKTDK